MRARAELALRLSRLGAAWPTIVVLTIAVTAAYSIAHYGLGHENPALACTVALSSLTLTRDARPRRVAETATAMVLGISVSATIVTVSSRGPAQLVLTLIVVLSCASFVSAKPAFALSAATQSMLVAVLADPVGGPYMRALDGMIGGAVALASVALLPRAPFIRAMRDGETALRDLASATHELARALDSGDSSVAAAAAARFRAVEAVSALWHQSLGAAAGIATFSPVSRGRRSDWDVRRRLQRGVAGAVPGLLLAARRSTVLLERRRPQPRSAALVRDIATVIEDAVRTHDDPRDELDADRLERLVRRVDALTVDGTVDPGIVAILRPVVVDVLEAGGATPEAARRALPAVAVPTATTPITFVRTTPRGDR